MAIPLYPHLSYFYPQACASGPARLSSLLPLLKSSCMYRKLLILSYLSLCCLWGNVCAQQVEQMLHARPVALSGNISLTSIFYKADGIPNRYLPFNYVIAGSPVLSLYGMQIPVSFVIGRQQSSFSQPFNQFGLSPSYKWVTIHAGYRSLVFSPYTLAGHTFLG